jgi:uncharacterized protein
VDWSASFSTQRSGRRLSLLVLAVVLLCQATVSTAAERSAVINRLMAQAYRYYVGMGVPVNHGRALQYYLQAAGQGDAEAQLIAGGMLYRGMGTDPNPREAFKLLLSAAEVGMHSPESLSIIGTMYLQGAVVPQNFIQAKTYLSMAADQGDLVAMKHLAYMLFNGLGGKKDYGRALTLYTKAGLHGDAEAQANTGLMYATGAGTMRDRTRAYAWYSLAASQGDSQAALQRNTLMAEMNWDELNRAQALSIELFRQVEEKKSRDQTAQGRSGP